VGDFASAGNVVAPVETTLGLVAVAAKAGYPPVERTLELKSAFEHAIHGHGASGSLPVQASLQGNPRRASSSSTAH
jgi:hypothetical protein